MGTPVTLVDRLGVAVTVGGTGTSAGQVQGPAATGAAAVGSPILTGGTFNTAYPTLDTGDVGALRLTAAGSLITEGNVAAAATDSGNPLKVGGKYNSTLPTYTDGQRGDVQLGSRGSLRTEITGAGSTAGAAVNTVISDPSATIGLIVASVPKAVTSGGLSLARVVTGNTGVIKASVGQLYTLSAYNSNAAVRYLHLYNKATAPTLSTDTPAMTIPLLGAGITHVPLSNIGIAFATGIAWAYTTDDIAIPTTAGTSAELHFTAGYK